MKQTQQRHCYGTTTVGEKGQVVIPAEAREAMKLKKGDKLLVFGLGCDMIAFSTLDSIEKQIDHLSTRLTRLKSALSTQKPTHS